MINFNYDKMAEQIINMDIKRKFLDATGLSTLWNNMVKHVAEEIEKISKSNESNLANIVARLDANESDITTINNSLNSYRGYPTSSLESSNTSFDLLPNTYYTLHLTSPKTINITLVHNDNTNVTSEYVLEIDTTNGIPTLGLPSIIWENDDVPEFEIGYKYVISIIKNSENDTTKAVYGKYKL